MSDGAFTLMLVAIVFGAWAIGVALIGWFGVSWETTTTTTERRKLDAERELRDRETG